MSCKKFNKNIFGKKRGTFMKKHVFLALIPSSGPPEDGSTLYLLQHEHQALPVAAEEHITFTPHYDTLIRGGMYEYYASQGQAPLAYTLAELIDNALSATAKNKGQRTIEIRLNDRTVGKPAIVVLDNGCGMTSKQLNNWAVYRLSKFTKESSTFASDKEVYVRPEHVPRSLNSDISYFGVGGKQAVFYIGDSARMISKPVGSPDVHELVLSKEEFVRKEKNKEDVFSGVIVNRKPGDSSHIKNNDERLLQNLITEEHGKESFTAVVITGVQSEHITFLTERFDVVTRELAHIYHYYIHGVNGNVRNKSSSNSDDLKIDIHVTLREKPPKYPRAIHLREVEDDMQTLYINAAADTFEFRASTAADNFTIEGIIRYHPFLYDKETYPKCPYASQVHMREKGKRPIFECFWNGRLIPYTTVSEPVLKYVFLLVVNNLCLSFFNKNFLLFFFPFQQKSSKRANIDKEFTQWLQNCHEKFDKQVKFIGYQGTMGEDLLTKKMQRPCAMFSSIEWDGKTYKTGQLVKSLGTKPVFYGTIVRFLLHGIYDGDVFATGGQVEVIREPKALYSTTKIIPIAKIDRNATDEAIKKNIENDLVEELPPVTVDCSNTGAGQLTTKPINLKIIDGQPQVRKAHFEIPSQRHVASVIRELKVNPSTRVTMMEVYSADADKLVLRNNDKIITHHPPHDLLDKMSDILLRPSLHCQSRLYRSWMADVDLEDLIQGKLPDIQVPTRVKEEHVFQVSYHDQSVSVSFTITPHPDEPTRLKVTLPQSTVRLGEVLPGNINLEPVDQYDNVTKTLSPTCVRDMSVEQCSSSVAVTGVRFNSGPLGHREMCFKYATFVERIKIEVTAGVPAELKLISGPEQTKGFCVCAVFSVTVVSEEGSPITTFNPTAVSMFLWHGVSSGGTPPPTVTELKCSKPMEHDKDGRFYFRDEQIPEHAGPHVIQFSLRETKLLFSDQVGLKILSILAIMENSPGQNGSAYTLLFQPEVPNVPTPLSPFELQFHFYNDAENQMKMSALSKKKDELTVAISAHEDKQAKLKKQLDSSQTIDTLINKKREEVDKIRNSRRSCSISENFMLQPDVLGTVGHLAFVEDDTAAWVISWHIRGYMDCIITKTKEAAERIHRETQGRQQVMALDSVFVPPGNRPLPHIRNGRPLFDPHGNPVYARELLICPNDQESCGIVFKNFLGETILIDDLQSANSYRRVVQNKSPCPTILTRQGDKIDGKGVFGGAQNKAPHTPTWPLFGAPYHTLTRDIELLQQYQLAVRKREDAEKERNDLLKSLNSPEMKMKNQEMKEKKKLLEDTEKQLGMFVANRSHDLGAIEQKMQNSQLNINIKYTK
uniref:Structural maintenance of chromosomes flexible hinge domain-containing protein 1-like n=1 Tax=Acanthochromis polyacanthus TaxID=80966 RepID=A0A3Q1GGE3_9TELE